MSEPRKRAATLAALVDVLLPGDALFASAAEVGLQAKLAERLADHSGEAAVDRLIASLPGLVEAASGEARQRIVAAFEAAEPALFATVRSICFTSYYESPFVQEAIRSLGFAYNTAPLPKGYGLKRFDPATDAPRHGRGHYVPTEAVRRVDLGGLDIKELGHGE